MKRVAFITRGMRIIEVLWSEAAIRRRQQALDDLMLFGRCWTEITRDEVVLRSYRPRLP
jgi:predicted 2-oxoglutarate/Fe(II)-dependent dioxygenase YbiX